MSAEKSPDGRLLYLARSLVLDLQQATLGASWERCPGLRRHLLQGAAMIRVAILQGAGDEAAGDWRCLAGVARGAVGDLRCLMLLARGLGVLSGGAFQRLHCLCNRLDNAIELIK